MPRTFDGNGSLLFSGWDAAALSVTGAPLTLFGWGYATSLAADRTIIAITDTAGNDDYFSLNLDTTGAAQCAINRSTVLSVLSGNTVSTNTWAHCCYVGATGGASHLVYIDGVVGTEDTTSKIPLGLDTLSFGRTDAFSAGLPMIGRTFFSGVYNDSISANDVLMLAKGADPRTIRRDALAALSVQILDEDVERMSHTFLAATGTGHSVHNTIPPNCRLLGRGRSRRRGRAA